MITPTRLSRPHEVPPLTGSYTVSLELPDEADTAEPITVRTAIDFFRDQVADRDWVYRIHDEVTGEVYLVDSEELYR